MKTNVQVKKPAKRTHEGAPVVPTDSVAELRRSVLACMLWENTFYEGGVDIAKRIHKLVKEVPARDVSLLAIEARKDKHMRHAPLWLLVALFDHHKDAGSLLADTVAEVVSRPDEMGELLNMWFEGKGRKERKIPMQMRKGIARAFTKFDEYQLAKWDRKANVNLKDVLNLVHPKPANPVQAEMWGRLLKGQLNTPDTWEVALSDGADKKEVFTRLLMENKLGYMALLMNLRNMAEVGVEKALVENALIFGARKSKALPFRFIQAAKHVPLWEDALEKGMFEAMKGYPMFKGGTSVIVDTSGSMTQLLSDKSQTSAKDAAIGLAIMARELCEDVNVFAFATDVKELKPRRGFALADEIRRAHVGHGTDMGKAVDYAQTKYPRNRVIIVSDMQSRTRLSAPNVEGYCLNVASYKNAVGYGQWTNINGFSANSLLYMMERENASIPF